ncbi:HNH endonuclease signature motif containing protein [Streptomyces exfoliatus]|uniref:HNH endonuclease signature motif containing protein n=1 Tax=Streptomyces exfoliatus TaxID=1905 RepID=UPI00046305DF|nr:HNH endonuclease signature motif containing protein [Streptomyces exfoliatus]
MWPADPLTLSARESWNTCTSLSRDTKSNDRLGTRLRAAEHIAEDAANAFRAAALSRTLFSLKSEDFQVSDIPGARVSDIVYDSGMTNGPGRAIYDEVMDGRDEDLCPMCRHTEVTQLDHVMPKKAFPALCVAPDNLVGVCGFCNFTKGDGTTEDSAKVLLHPYFEDAATELWLKAETTPGSAGVLRYFVAAPPHWDPVFASRVRHQFDFLELGKRYSSKANQILSGMRQHFGRQLNASGASGLKTHLDGLAASHRADDLNGWAGVAYSSWAADQAFCQGSFIVS